MFCLNVPCWNFVPVVLHWHGVNAVSIATMRVISERHLAAMVAKGICQFPENGDRLGGTIDIWWIVRILPQFCYNTPTFRVAQRCCTVQNSISGQQTEIFNQNFRIYRRRIFQQSLEISPKYLFSLLQKLQLYNILFHISKLRRKNWQSLAMLTFMNLFKSASHFSFLFIVCYHYYGE